MSDQAHEFDATLWRHDGPAAWHFISLPDELADELRAVGNGTAGKSYTDVVTSPQIHAMIDAQVKQLKRSTTRSCLRASTPDRTLGCRFGGEPL
ncbi:MAG: DUF1905 domain-containing protein [Solirubrobacterales bacterium]